MRDLNKMCEHKMVGEASFQFNFFLLLLIMYRISFGIILSVVNVVDRIHTILRMKNKKKRRKERKKISMALGKKKLFARLKISLFTNIMQSETKKKSDTVIKLK